jgi:GGDEF domain-containing protein
VIGSLTLRQRLLLYLTSLALLVTGGAVSLISAVDPDALWMRVGMILMAVGLGLWAPRLALLPAVLAAWLLPNAGRAYLLDAPLIHAWSLAELPGLALLALLATAAHYQLQRSDTRPGQPVPDFHDLDPAVLPEWQFRADAEVELARCRRFERQFAVMLIGVEGLRKRFDYRDEQAWRVSFLKTSSVLTQTRALIDRVYRYGDRSFGMVLPESGADEVNGLVRRLTREAQMAEPPLGAPGGPLSVHFGAALYPDCASSVDELFRRAEIALRLAEKSPTRLKVDGAAAPDVDPKTLRRRQADRKAPPAAKEEPASAEPASERAAPQVLAAEPTAANSEATDRVAARGYGEKPAPEPRFYVIPGGKDRRPGIREDAAEAESAPEPAIEEAMSDLLRELDERIDAIRWYTRRSA